MSEETLAAQHNDDSFANVWQELKWRGLVHVSTDEEALEKALSEESINFYIGYDPTAASLHLGHLVQLLLMRRLQLAGHNPFGLVGGATGLIGDPRQTSERVLNSRDVVEGWVDRLRGQIERFLSFEGEHAARMVNNLEWTSELSAIDFLREIGKNFRVGTMIKKEIVAKRLNSDEGISYTEFSYQILQGNDFLELNRRYGISLQCGGSDQWGNLTSGTELVRKVEGKSVHALGTPLITNSDGTKFGKSEGNAIWLDPEMCSPYAFYQFWLNTADADVTDRLKVFTFKTREEIAQLQKSVEEEPFRRLAQKTLAFEVTSLVHGVDATEKVIAASKILYTKDALVNSDVEAFQIVVKEAVDLGNYDDNSSGYTSSSLLSIKASRKNIVGSKLEDIAVRVKTVRSLSEFREKIKSSAISINGKRISDAQYVINENDILHGKYVVLKNGKKKFTFIELGN